MIGQIFGKFDFIFVFLEQTKMLTEDIKFGPTYKIRHPDYWGKTVGDVFYNNREWCAQMLYEDNNEVNDILRECIQLTAIKEYEDYIQRHEMESPNYDEPFILTGKFNGKDIRDVFDRNFNYFLNIYNKPPLYVPKYENYYKLCCWISHLYEARGGYKYSNKANKTKNESTSSTGKSEMKDSNGHSSSEVVKSEEQYVSDKKGKKEKIKKERIQRDPNSLNSFEENVLRLFMDNKSVDDISSECNIKPRSVEMILVKCLYLGKLTLDDVNVSKKIYEDFISIIDGSESGEATRTYDIIKRMKVDHPDITPVDIDFCRAFRKSMDQRTSS